MKSFIYIFVLIASTASYSVAQNNDTVDFSSCIDVSAGYRHFNELGGSIVLNVSVLKFTTNRFAIGFKFTHQTPIRLITDGVLLAQSTLTRPQRINVKQQISMRLYNIGLSSAYHFINSYETRFSPYALIDIEAFGVTIDKHVNEKYDNELYSLSPTYEFGYGGKSGGMNLTLGLGATFRLTKRIKFFAVLQNTSYMFNSDEYSYKYLPPNSYSGVVGVRFIVDFFSSDWEHDPH